MNGIHGGSALAAIGGFQQRSSIFSMTTWQALPSRATEL
jgi:hypothetical protein